MEQALPIVLVVVLIILTIILSIVGIYLLTVLSELKKTLTKVNTTMDTAEEKITAISVPLQQIGGLAVGMRSGMQVLESFVGWLHKDEEK